MSKLPILGFVVPVPLPICAPLGQLIPANCPEEQVAGTLAGNTTSPGGRVIVTFSRLSLPV